MVETRAQLEARLKNASDSMNRRLSAMENEVKLPTVAGLAGISTPTGKSRAKKVAVAVGIGLVVGLAFGGGKKRASGKRSSSVDSWREELADSLNELLQEGKSPEEAARRAARAQPPVVVDGDDSGKGLLAFILGYAVRVGVNTAARELMKRVMDRNAEPDRS